MGIYEGVLTRKYGAHYGRRPSVPGVNREHTHPDPDPDPFSPEIQAPSAQAGDVWSADELAGHTDMSDEQIHHWTRLVAPVPSSVPLPVAQLAQQNRMLANHAPVRYRPDTARSYTHDTIGRVIEYTEGRGSRDAGQDVPEDLSYLVMGTNAYDRTNQPNEVYSAESTGGRYRLGGLWRHFGLYGYPVQKQGQDGVLRAYEGLHPAAPLTKPHMDGTAPYTAPSFGTANWLLPHFQVPRLFSLPSETAVVDYTMAAEDEPIISEFDDAGRL